MARAPIKMLYKMYKSICQVYESTCRYGTSLNPIAPGKNTANK